MPETSDFTPVDTINLDRLWNNVDKAIVNGGRNIVFTKIASTSTKNIAISTIKRLLADSTGYGLRKVEFDNLKKTYPDIPCYPVSDTTVKIAAGWLIEKCGWKGKSVGPVAVHGSQALVLINKGGANGLDIINLSDSIRASVRDKFGIELIPEVNIIFG